MRNLGGGSAVIAGVDEPLAAYLGPAEGRYFSSGYRHVQYGVGVSSSASALHALGRVRYPDDWSLDGEGRSRLPHLSSIDAVILSLLSLEQAAPAVSELELDALYVEAIRLRAGASPWERLADVPVELSCVPGPDRVRLDGTAGNIRVHIRIADSGRRDPVRVGGQSVYGELFRATHCRTVDLQHVGHAVLLGSHSADLSSERQPKGLESRCWPGLTIVDYLVTLAQMTQALVYSSAGLTRATAGPLWMRTMQVERDGPPNRAAESNFVSRAEMTRDRVIQRANERLHDVQVVVQTTSGVRATSTLAYTESGT